MVKGNKEIYALTLALRRLARRRRLLFLRSMLESPTRKIVIQQLYISWGARLFIAHEPRYIPARYIDI